MTLRRLRGAVSTAASLLMLAAALVACAEPTPDLADGLYVQIDTAKGRMILRLEPEKAPIAVMSFVGLTEGTIDNDVSPGRPYFDGLTFHRVEPGFVIQGGDPNGDGTGGPGYRFPNETHPDLLHDGPGVLAMANSGPDTNGSQFYITMDATPFLDGGYTVFGRIVEGQEIVDSTEVGDEMREVTILRIGDAAEGYQASDDEFASLIDALYAAREAEVEAAREAALAAAIDVYPGMTEDPETGLYFASLGGGGGAPPVEGEEVEIHIVFRTIDGTQLDSTRDRNEPQTFVYLRDRLIPGLELAIGQMGVGESGVALVSPDLGFGAAGLPGAVEPNSFVIFEIERLR